MFFLHGFLKDDIYMKLPQGYKKGKTGQVCKLVCSLYGLKQASREWNLEFCKKLFEFGFTHSHSDHCLFIKGSGSTFICLLVYVDDVLLTSPMQSLIDEVRDYLHAQFTIKDLGSAKFFLGIEIARSEAGTVLCQRKYILDIISQAGLLECRSVSTPLPAGLVLTQGTEARLEDPEPYRRLVGQLLYLNLTRPDISYVAQQLSQYVANPTHSHWTAALHVLRYLKGCPSLGLFISTSNSLALTAYSDADWASCIDSRNSLTGYCVYFGSTLLSWKCKKQDTVSVSFAEAEYRALSITVREIMWLVSLLAELGISVSTPIPLYCDNVFAIHITKNQVFHERTKHLDIDCHLVREKYKSGLVQPLPISSSEQLADVFTKSLASTKLRYLLSKMELCDLHNIHLAGGEEKCS